MARKREFSRTLVIPFLLPLICIFLSSTRCLAISNPLNDTSYRNDSSSRLASIQSHLDKINKPPVFTIESPDGDIIDCVRESEQLAFDHPPLKHHKIQKVPPKMPNAMKMGRTNITAIGALGQTWHQKGQWCPKGTVPIRRTTIDDVLRATSLDRFGKKDANSLPHHARPADGNGATIHEYAVAMTTKSQVMKGTKASIGLWGPMVETSGEFSLSQLWAVSGSGSDTNTIEVGWQVYPRLYGDNKPRLFVYWTRDGYQSTGCYNLLCSGFVQTSRKVVVGAVLTPVSSIGRSLYEFTVTVWKDPDGGNWWLAFGDEYVGYWPSKIFTQLADKATIIEWGGEIINSRPNNKHTSTNMGSGRFAEDLFGKANYFRNLEIVVPGNILVSAQDAASIVTNPNCYNILISKDDGWGTYFFYGGPGRSPRCP